MRRMMGCGWMAYIFGVVSLSACATTNSLQVKNSPDIYQTSITAPLEPVSGRMPDRSIFVNLPYWQNTNFKVALQAFKKSCEQWSSIAPEAFLDKRLPKYGRYEDWKPVCAKARTVEVNSEAARAFFSDQFVPVSVHSDKGLLTGYYQPEIDVRAVPDAEFSEPILALPKQFSVKNLPREKLLLSELEQGSVQIIAYGRPLDIFFMQIQGSGHIRFKDGRILRAAYDGNNGYDYTSIGRVLVERGELVLDKASKRDIENWMKQADDKVVREIMNINQRYIFFKTQEIEDEQSPSGAMKVPLTAMGSMAIDPDHHPYGVPVLLHVNLPQAAGDYTGKKSSLLLIAQDTGKAIKGAVRGDIYFGSGQAAGELAGVMKHQARWHILLPKTIHIGDVYNPLTEKLPAS